MSRLKGLGQINTYLGAPARMFPLYDQKLPPAKLISTYQIRGLNYNISC